jgi:hypothetical protein
MGDNFSWQQNAPFVVAVVVVLLVFCVCDASFSRLLGNGRGAEGFFFFGGRLVLLPSLYSGGKGGKAKENDEMQNAHTAQQQGNKTQKKTLRNTQNMGKEGKERWTSCIAAESPLPRRLGFLFVSGLSNVIEKRNARSSPEHI